MEECLCLYLEKLSLIPIPEFLLSLMMYVYIFTLNYLSKQTNPSLLCIAQYRKMELLSVPTPRFLAMYLCSFFPVLTRLHPSASLFFLPLALFITPCLSLFPQSHPLFIHLSPSLRLCLCLCLRKGDECISVN